MWGRIWLCLAAACAEQADGVVSPSSGRHSRRMCLPWEGSRKMAQAPLSIRVGSPAEGLLDLSQLHEAHGPLVLAPPHLGSL